MARASEHEHQSKSGELMIKRLAMKIGLILSGSLFLTANAARVSADPTLKANPNPVIVPAGQTQGTTTLTWNTEGAEGYVWVSVDGGEESQLNEAGIAEGTLGATVEVGKSYAFKLYTADKEQLLASVTVSAAIQQAAPQPPPAARPGSAKSRARPGRITKEDAVSLIDSKRTSETLKLLTKPVNNGSVFQLICRGGPGLRFSTTGGFGHPVIMSIDFKLSMQPPDPSGRNLQPGQCSPADFPLSRFDPTQIQQEVSGDGKVGQSQPLPGEQFPHLLDASVRVQHYIDYLTDPKNYWSFNLYDIGKGYFGSTYGQYWKPEFYKPPPVKALGRVKVPPGTTPNPPISICDAAREARARNSPAAPGLEEKCRADLAAKGAAIAQVDEIVAQGRAAETDALYREGFDIAPGIFGDPALGAQGNTTTGPGSLRIRDSLSAAGQRGFNASVKLHLGRKY